MINLSFKFEVVPQEFNGETETGWRVRVVSATCNNFEIGGGSFPLIPSYIKKCGLDNVLEELFPGLLFYELRKKLKQKINDENETERITK